MTAYALDLSARQSGALVNKPQGPYVIPATENSLAITVGGKARKVMFVGTVDWYYRTTASGNNLPVSALSPLTLMIGGPTTFYMIRQGSTDGELTATMLE